MTEKYYKYLVRLPTDLRDQLADSAARYHRSLNSDMVARLQQSFGQSVPEERPVSLLSHSNGLPSVIGALNRDLSTDEINLLRRFRGLSPARRAALLDLLS